MKIMQQCHSFKGVSIKMKKCNINILFTSSGRRVSLIKKFRETMQEKGFIGKIITADLKVSAPTAFHSDRHYKVPRVSEENYLNKLLSICKLEDINLLIPLIDTELLLLSKNRRMFEELGVRLLISSTELNEIASDKVVTFKYFTENNIETPKVYTQEELKKEEYSFPLLIKPRNGSSSNGVNKINNKKELDFFRTYIPNAMVQEFICGEEYTIDVMTDFHGNIKTIVPRQRIETRSGEVSKGITSKDLEIINATERVIKKLPGPVGCITLQCFKTVDGKVVFIEINPRFGGGIPLSIEAGANFPLWTIEASQEEIFEQFDFSWKDNLTMLRYDEAIFTENGLNECQCTNI